MKLAADFSVYGKRSFEREMENGGDRRIDCEPVGRTWH